MTSLIFSDSRKDMEYTLTTIIVLVLIFIELVMVRWFIVFLFCHTLLMTKRLTTHNIMLVLSSKFKKKMCKKNSTKLRILLLNNISYISIFVSVAYGPNGLKCKRISSGYQNLFPHRLSIIYSLQNSWPCLCLFVLHGEITRFIFRLTTISRSLASCEPSNKHSQTLPVSGDFKSRKDRAPGKVDRSSSQPLSRPGDVDTPGSLLTLAVFLTIDSSLRPVNIPVPSGKIIV